MENKVEITKLEELMYISLIGKFEYVQICDKKKYLAFTSNISNEDLEAKVKPIYITDLSKVSDKVLLSRIKNFEKKVFPSVYCDYLEKNKMMIEDKEVICYSKRIKSFINKIYSKLNLENKRKIFYGYTKNLEFLRNETVIDDEQLESAKKFVVERLVKESEKAKI